MVDNKKTKVLVGISGGVDSAVAAYLLLKQGYDVTGAFMRNWDSMANNDVLGNPTLNDDQCSQEVDYADAKAVASLLGIQLLRVDFIEEYWDHVFLHFLEEYQVGRTPNPDIFCNKYIKFDAFLTYAKKQGFDYIATGHYAKKVVKDGRADLLKAHDLNKDQTYFLSQLSQYQLAAALFPLGNLPKEEVRQIAHDLNLKSVMDKKDSTGICFIGERNFKQFLTNYLPAHQGDIVDINNNRVLGKHDGVLYYTIGQRRGLGIGGIAGEEAKGWFVVNKDVEKNILYVASGDEDAYLYSNKAIIKVANWINKRPRDGAHLSAKFRYRQADQSVTLTHIDETTFMLAYPQGVKAVTPGQAAVIYDGDICLGGGIIDEVYRDDKKMM